MNTEFSQVFELTLKGKIATSRETHGTSPQSPIKFLCLTGKKKSLPTEKSLIRRIPA